MMRIVTVALAASTLAFAAYAQTGSSSGSTSSPSTTTSPSTSGTMGTGTGSSTGSSTMGSGSSSQQAQQPFDATKYKTKSECLTAATAAHASTSACDSLR